MGGGSCSSWGINAQYEVSEDLSAGLRFCSSEREGRPSSYYLSGEVSYAFSNDNILELSYRHRFSESLKDGSTDLVSHLFYPFWYSSQSEKEHRHGARKSV